MEKKKIIYKLIGEKLPKNIMESELDDISKEILIRLIYWLNHSQAKETGIIKLSNKKLLELLNMSSVRRLMYGIEELKDYSLIERIRGTELGNASRYIINFENFTKTLKRKSESDFLKELMDIQNLSKRPFGLDKDIDKDIDKEADIDKDIEADINKKFKIEINIKPEKIENNIIIDSFNYVSKDILKIYEEPEIAYN